MESLKEAISNNMNSIDYLAIFNKLYKNEEESNLTKLSIWRVFMLYYCISFVINTDSFAILQNVKG